MCHCSCPIVGIACSGCKLEWGGTKVKTVYQDTDPSASNYLNNRRALVGPGCMINSLFDGVEVVSETKDLQNICNDDLDDYAAIPALAEVTLVGSPIISVKDNQHYYAGGTEAGFVICAKSDASILTLDLAKFYKIQFLKDGEKVGDLQTISTGKSVTGLGLSLLTFPGSDQVNKLYMATAPGNFDEIKLVQCGVNAKLGSAINIKYAFVGKAREYTITNNKDNGIAKYSQEQNRGSFKLSANTLGGDLINADLTDNFTVQSLIVSVPAKVTATSSDNKEAFPAGTEVGFKYGMTQLLDIDLGSTISLNFYNKDGKSITSQTISGTVLNLGLAGSKKNSEVVMKAPNAFSAVEIYFGGVKVNLGAIYVNYAFVRMAPDAASHHCPINATSSRDMCGCENTIQLQHNKDVDVTWTVQSHPADADDVAVDATGMVTNIYIPGKYVFRATAADDCFEETTINYAPTYNTEENGLKILVNKDGEARKYNLSDKFGGGLIQIFSGMKNRTAILTPTLNDYTYRQPGIDLAANQGLVGIKSVGGANIAEGLNGKLKAGFVVTSKTTGLDADVLKFYNIKLYNNGQEVTGAVTTHWDAISAGLIGSEDAHKMRFSIDVPEGCVFDEIVLYSTGVLSANLAQLNIYYAYVSEANADNAATNPLYGAQVVSLQNTNATIDFANTKMFHVANIGNGYNELGNLIDDSMDTYLTLPLGVDLGGAKISVNMGKVVDRSEERR